MGRSGSVMIWETYDWSKGKTVSFSDFKNAPVWGEICEAWVPLFGSGNTLCSCGAGRGWGSSGLWGPGQPSGASFRGAEWGIRGELSQEALHKACIGHSCWACHPGVCPQGWGPSELLTASDPSAEGKGNPGGAAGSGAAWSLQVTVRVTWVTRFS